MLRTVKIPDGEKHLGRAKIAGFVDGHWKVVQGARPPILLRPWSITGKIENGAEGDLYFVTAQGGRGRYELRL